MPLAMPDVSARTRGIDLCRSRALDWSDAALQLWRNRLCQARSARDQAGVAQAADRLADIHTARADFRRAATLRREAAEASYTPERNLAARRAAERCVLHSEQSYFLQGADTRDVLRCAKRDGKLGPREDDLVMLLLEVQRTRSTRVLNAAASAARACRETELAYGLLDRSLGLEPEIQANPAAFVVLASLLNDEQTRSGFVLARDIVTEGEGVDPGNRVMHKTAVVTWRALGNRDEAARHAAAAKRRR